MSDRDRKTDQTQSALRLMEALSGVDQELLLRSESRRRPYWSYGRAAAACLALVTVGVLSWNGLRMIWTPKGGAGSSSAGGNGYDSAPMLADARSNETAESEADSGKYSTSVAAEDAGTGSTESMDDATKEDLADTETQIQDLESSKEHDQSKYSTNEQPEDNTKASDSSQEEVCADPRDLRTELSEDEARNTDIFGAYLPKKLPAGYTFENARGGDGGITVTWTRGRDSIMISVSFAEPESAVTVDVEKPETYDVWLYEIPYGETVPEEYRQVFNDPIFAAEDLSLEVVRSRMKSIRDAGDTDTPRGSFSVLYPDGVVLHFNGRGTADEIWEMLHS